MRAFLQRGGKLELLLDPPDGGKAPDVTGLIALAHDWGIDVGNNLLVDASGLGQMLGTDASVPVAMPVAHPITNNFRVMTAFPLARSVRPVEGGVDGHTAQPCSRPARRAGRNPTWRASSPRAAPSGTWSKRRRGRPGAAGRRRLGAVDTRPAAGETPPADADAPKPETRLVVVGDSDFARNRAIGIQGNREIFLNMANWLAQQEDLIAIRPADPANRPITMTAESGLLGVLVHDAHRAGTAVPERHSGVLAPARLTDRHVDR